MNKRGFIALDIDGTITTDKHSVPVEVRDYFKNLEKKGWIIIVLTGRSFTFASQTLTSFDFPYYFCPQNGSVIFSMPQKKLISKFYLNFNAIKVVEKVYRTSNESFLVYGGYERNDDCFYRPKKFSEEGLAYLNKLKNRQPEKLVAVDEFDEELLKSFPLIKGFGNERELKPLLEELDTMNLFSLVIIRDLFFHHSCVFHINAKEAGKGNAILHIQKKLRKVGPVIAAGDDANDVSTFRVASIKIAMENAPNELKLLSDYIAPSAEKMGIISAMDKAIENLERL